MDRPTNRRRPMRRVGDMLPKIAADIGIEDELRLARQMSGWERLVEEHLPAARGASKLIGIESGALVVSASDGLIAQELRLRQSQLLEAFGRMPDGAHLLELRVVVRPSGRVSNPR